MVRNCIMALFWRVTTHINVFMFPRDSILKETFDPMFSRLFSPQNSPAKNKIFHQKSAREAPYHVTGGLALSGLCQTLRASFLPTPHTLFCSLASLKWCFSVLGLACPTASSCYPSIYFKSGFLQKTFLNSSCVRPQPSKLASFITLTTSISESHSPTRLCAS